MIERLILAVIIGVVVGLVCILAGRLLKAAGVPPAVAVGTFLEEYAWAIGIIAALWAFITGWRP